MNGKVFHDPWGIRGPGAYTYSLYNVLSNHNSLLLDCFFNIMYYFGKLLL